MPPERKQHAEQGTDAHGGEARHCEWPEQDENGVDLTLIRANLRLSPLERARKAERLRRGVMRMHRLAEISRDPESA